MSRSTEIELSTIHARSPHLSDEPVTPAATVEDDAKSLCKSLENVEAAETERAQSVDIPPTAVTASTPAMRRKARIQFATLCWCLFLAGWNDGTTGPLLPRMQTVYHVRS